MIATGKIFEPEEPSQFVFFTSVREVSINLSLDSVNRPSNVSVFLGSMRSN